MTIRSRLVAGFVTIAVVLLVPLVYALFELDELRRETRGLRDTEFAALLTLGRIREAGEQILRLEAGVTFGARTEFTDSMTAAYSRLMALTDSLRRTIPGRTQRIDSATAAMGIPISALAAASRSGRRSERMADSIFVNHLRPAMSAIDAALPAVQEELNDSTTRFFHEATIAAEQTERAGLLGLSIAALLAGVIAMWLTRSISEPVRDLERAMRTVSDGDYSYELRTEQAPTEFSRLSRSYRSMVQQLAELDKLKAEFVSVASHELKTPINVVSGYLQLLDEGVYGELTEQQREVCRLLETQTQQLARLVNQLLDVSRFEAGGGRLETAPLSLRSFLGDLEGSFSVLARQRDIAFRVSVADGLPDMVEWDEDRMSEVVGNLLSNAFKFTPRGGTVDLAVYNENTGIRMEVRDSGVGIPREQLSRVFDKFYQAANRGDSSGMGTGLGLAIAREIVEAHGGNIGVESVEGAGTAFTITVPLQSEGGREMLSRRLTPAVRTEVQS